MDPIVSLHNQHTLLSQKTVLRFLTERGASELVTIRFQLDAQGGNVYPDIAVKRVLDSLLRAGKVKRVGDFYSIME